MSGKLCTARPDGYWWSGAAQLLPYSAAAGDGFILGTTKPTATNTGLGVLGLTTADLTVVNGDLILNDAYVAAHGANIDRLWVKGHLIFTATSPVTITNSQIEGRTFTGSAPYEFIVRARNTSAPSTSRLNLTNCKIFAIQPDVGISTVGGERLGNLYRCDISLGSDLVDYWNPARNVSVRGCYLHDFSFWDNDPQRLSDPVHPGWAHTDAIQISAGDNVSIEGNNFHHFAAPGVGGYSNLIANSTYANAAYGGVVIMTPSDGTITNVSVNNNWIHGGDAQIHLATQPGKPYNAGNSFTASGNRHGYDCHPWGPYSGKYNREFYVWDNGMMPSNDVVSGCTWDTTADVPSALRGTPIPAVAYLSGAVQYQSYYQTATPDL